MPRLFACTEEISAEELKEALKQTSATKAQSNGAQITSAPVEPVEDGVAYTYYRGIKTAVNKPGTQPNTPQNTALLVATPADPAAPASSVASPALIATSPVAAQAVTPSVPAAPPPYTQAKSPSAEAALLHVMEQLRAGMLEMSRRLQEIQEMQQLSGRKENETTQ